MNLQEEIDHYLAGLRALEATITDDVPAPATSRHEKQVQPDTSNTNPNETESVSPKHTQAKVKVHEEIDQHMADLGRLETMITDELATFKNPRYEKRKIQPNSWKTDLSETQSAPTTHSQANKNLQEDISQQLAGAQAIEAMITNTLAIMKSSQHQIRKIRPDSSEDDFSTKLKELRQ